MNNYWAIAIGINQYQEVQPLSYAQADAQALWNFLVGKAGFMPDRCLLLTDNSPFIEGQSTYPTKENLKKWIDWLCRDALKSGDRVWCFFSGYGLTWEGQDYLMPIDGSLSNISETAISMRSLLEGLNASPAKVEIALLDLHRQQAVQSDAWVGTQTLELARELKIPTVLSCQPSQFAYESSELHHGLFTATLLEGLNSDAGRTLAGVQQHLSDRLPKLSEKYGQQRQDPAIAIPEAIDVYQLIVPPNGIAQVNGNWSGSGQRPAAELAAVGATLSPSLAAVQQHMQNVSSIPGSQNPFQDALNNIEPSFANDAEDQSMSSSPQEPNDRTTPNNNDPTGLSSGSLWQKILLWTGGALLGLLVLLLIGTWARNQFFASRPQEGTVPTLSGKSPTVSSAKTPEQLNRQILNDSKLLMRDNQVAQIGRAIVVACKIKKGEPFYNEAQDLVERWSLTILNTAEGRALKGNFTGAIAAANLIPKEHPVYQDRDIPQIVNRWNVAAKQQQSNKAVLESAKKLIRTGQASSYNDGITVARKVPAGQPVYAEAQQVINQWSETIYSLAQSRASQGNLNAAISTANLVPEGTAAYAKAQQAIVRWKGQLGTPQ